MIRGKWVKVFILSSLVILLNLVLINSFIPVLKTQMIENKTNIYEESYGIRQTYFLVTWIATIILLTAIIVQLLQMWHKRDDFIKSPILLIVFGVILVSITVISITFNSIVFFFESAWRKGLIELIENEQELKKAISFNQSTRSYLLIPIYVYSGFTVLFIISCWYNPFAKKIKEYS
ncbi:hypothetical protein [Mycoplasma sp. Ms02]|uniref:hypothetical protein n=1 Tax=Mycoplasma sp. Ms02 TaxID=353851 RepID=UPI001C896A04|nr:hypothetical protein [Mycoplasma sp. Ms02]QZE12312.1 hypothetical protein K4L35_03195 [Mycoplasma sp. Ms02]